MGSMIFIDGVRATVMHYTLVLEKIASIRKLSAYNLLYCLLEMPYFIILSV